MQFGDTLQNTFSLCLSTPVYLLHSVTKMKSRKRQCVLRYTKPTKKARRRKYRSWGSMNSHRGHGTRTRQDRGGGKLAGWRSVWYLCNVFLWCVLAEPVCCVGVVPVPLYAEATGGDQISSSRSLPYFCKTRSFTRLETHLSVSSRALPASAPSLSPVLERQAQKSAGTPGFLHEFWGLELKSARLHITLTHQATSLLGFLNKS